MNKAVKNVLIICGCVIVIGAGGTYFYQKNASATKTETATITYAVERGDLSKTVTSSGNVEAPESVNLSFSGNAKVTKVNVSVGEAVKKGQLLAAMDATALQNELLSAQAKYDSAVAKLDSIQAGTDSAALSEQKAQVSKAQSDLENAKTALTNAKKAANASYLQAQVDKAKAAVISTQAKLDEAKKGTDPSQILFAQVAADNAQNAYKQAVSQQSNLDQLKEAVTNAESQVDSASRAYDQAVSQLAKLQEGPAESDVASAKADVAMALAALNDAKANAAGAKIYAPYDGIISAVNAKVGETVAGDAASAISMYSTGGSFRISASIDDTDITDVKVGQDVNITFDALTGVTLKGKVVSKAVLGEAQTSGVVTFPVGIEITAGQDNADKLIPGISATIAIITDGKKDVLKVPDAAIKSFGGRKIVMVDKGGKEEQVEITTGLDDGANSEVLTGLSEGDKVTITMTTTKTSTGTSQGTMGGFGGMGGMGGFGGMNGGGEMRQFNRGGGTGGTGGTGGGGARSGGMGGGGQ